MLYGETTHSRGEMQDLCGKPRKSGSLPKTGDNPSGYLGPDAARGREVESRNPETAQGVSAMPELFQDAKSKIKWANQHIHELNGKLSEFLQPDAYSLAVKHNPDAGIYVLTFTMTKPVPDEIQLRLGDILHHLRTVLDYVAVELVERAGGSTKHVKFPVRANREELEAALNGGEIKVAGSDIVTLILNVIQPYQRGNGDSIFVLHSLDIGDKHFRLTPIISVAALTHVHGRAGPATFTDCAFGVDAGGKVNVLAMPGKFEFQGYGQPAFAVSFGKGQPFEGQAIIPTLHQLAQLVAGTVEAIEQVVLASA